MKKTNKISLIAILAISAGLYACNSGNNSNSSSTPATTRNALSGPNDYQLIASSLAKAEKNSHNSSKFSLKNDGNVAGNVAFWAFRTTAFIPATAPILGNIAQGAEIWSHFGGKTASELQVEQIQEINNEIYALDLAVENLSKEVSELSAAFSNFVKTSTATNYANAKGDYTTNTNYLGTYQSTSTQVGAANFYYDQMKPVYDTGGSNESALIQAAMKAFYCLNGTTCSADSGLSYINALTSNYNNVVAAISGSFVNVTPNEESSSDIYKYVSIIDNNAQASNILYGYLYYGLQDFLETNMPNPYDNGTANIIPYLNAYNTWAVQIFEQNIAYLQSLYLMEASNNVLNYVAYINNNQSANNIQYICPFEPKYSSINFLPSTGGCAAAANPALSGAVSIDQAQQILLATQQNLAQLFAARVNALYQVTISNMIGDKYSFYDAQTESMINMVRAKTLSNLSGTSVIGGGWQGDPSIYLYQYPYVSNTETWKSELINSAENNTPITTPPTYLYLPFESQTFYNGESITTYDINNNLYTLYYGTLCLNPYDGDSYPTSGSGLNAQSPNTGPNVTYVNPQAATAFSIPSCAYFNISTSYVAQNGYYGGTSFQVSNNKHDSFTVYFTNGIGLYAFQQGSSMPLWTTMNFNNNQNDYVAYFSSQPYPQTDHYQSSQNVETGGDSNSATIISVYWGVPVAMVQNNTNSNQYLYLNCLNIERYSYNIDDVPTYVFNPGPSASNEFYTCTTGSTTQITGQKDDLNNSYYTYTTIPSVTIPNGNSAAIYFQTEVYSDTLVPSITGNNTAYLSLY